MRFNRVMRSAAIFLAVAGVVFNASVCVCADEHSHGAAAASPAEHRDPQHGSDHHHGDGHAGDGSSHDHGSGEPCSCSNPQQAILCEAGAPPASTPTFATVAEADHVVPDVEPEPVSPLSCPATGPPRRERTPLHLRLHRLTI